MSGWRDLLRRRGLLMGSCVAVVVACVIVIGALEAERTFRVDVQGLVRNKAVPEAPFETFAELQSWVRDEGWTVTVRVGAPLEVLTNWRGEKRLRDRLQGMRVER